jgi:hypothetical protein
MDDVKLAYRIEKADPEGRFVRGFASVVEVDGKPVVDFQVDVISVAEIAKAAHAFVRDMRVAKVLHDGAKIGDVVESVVVDDAFAKALGMTDTRRGWWIGMEINDADVRKRVKTGELRAFSIGGSGKREKA